MNKTCARHRLPLVSEKPALSACAAPARRRSLAPFLARSLAVFSTLLVLGADTATQAASSPPAVAPSGKVFRFRLAFEPATLDWTLGDIPIWVIQNTMRGLYRVSEEGRVEPDLVQNVAVSNGDKQWVFTLKEGIRWSDGVPLNAAHATEALRRLFDPKTGSTYGYFLNDLDGADTLDPKKLGIKTLNERQFEIRLKHPTPYLPAILSHWVTYPVRPDLIAKHKDYGANPKHMAFLGAFTIEDWQHSLRLLLKPRPHATKKAFFERVEAWIIPDEQTALRLFETRHLELVSEPPSPLSDLSLERLGAKVREVQSPILYFIGLHPSHPLTRSREGILALRTALTRAELPKALGLPHRIAESLCPPEIAALIGGIADPALSEAERAFTPRQWLERAGLGDISKLPPLPLAYFEKPQIRELAQWIQAQWKEKLGIAVELEGGDPKTYWRYLAGSPRAAFLNSKGASYPDPDAFFDLFLSTNPQNLGRWKNSLYDEAALKGGEALGAKRREFYEKAARLALVERPALIPLYFRASQYLIQPYVQDLKINFLTSVDFSDASYVPAPPPTPRPPRR